MKLIGFTGIMMNVISRDRLFSFPNPVNEVSARLVAAGVVVQGGLFLVTRWPIVLVTLAYGFLARVLTGPKLSPLGQVVTRLVTPRLPFAEKLTAGPPKRFAQGIGLAFSGSALVASMLGLQAITVTVLSALIFAASLEAFAGFCLGCKIFGLLMRAGVIPQEICEECNDLSLRWTRQPASLGNAA